jgi:putative nucleotidyltransferase with HDIG domain
MAMMHDLTKSDFTTLAASISAHRAALSDDIISHVGDTRVSALLVRSLVSAFSKSLVEGTPEIIVAWARMTSSTYGPEVVCNLIEVATEALCADVDERAVSFRQLIAYFEDVRSSVHTALLPGQDTHREGGTTEAVIEAVLTMLRARDDATAVHSYATGMWCRRLAHALALSTTMTERIVRAGLLHDIGKIATPQAILVKEGPLDENEWEIMRAHPSLGAEMLVDLPGLAPYAEIVRAHHERIDGKGYPRGLAGDEIPFEARVLAVADAFHSMTSDRPYRAALSYGRALEILAAGRGTQWEPRVIDAMTEIVVAARNSSSDADLNGPHARDAARATRVSENVSFAG